MVQALAYRMAAGRARDYRAPVDARRFAPAAARNRGPILDVLRRVLPGRGLVLEIGSGTGQHVAHLAAALPSLRWQPSELDRDLHASIAAWSDGLDNVRAPIALDARCTPWPVPVLAAVFSANVIHIAPWDVCLGLLGGAGRHLAPGGVLVLYGPYRIGGGHTAESNAAFDRQLREMDPSFGVRDLEAVRDAAAIHGLELAERVEMPANNQTVVFARAPQAAST
jgi:SAM-dependent methyltransferase